MADNDAGDMPPGKPLCPATLYSPLFLTEIQPICVYTKPYFYRYFIEGRTRSFIVFFLSFTTHWMQITNNISLTRISTRFNSICSKFIRANAAKIQSNVVFHYWSYRRNGLVFNLFSCLLIYLLPIIFIL